MSLEWEVEGEGAVVGAEELLGAGERADARLRINRDGNRETKRGRVQIFSGHAFTISLLIRARLTGRPYVSFSQISQMRSCPRKFSFHYIEHARPDFLPASLVFGTAVHAAVETHFRGILAGVATSAGDLLQAYWLAWREPKGGGGRRLADPIPQGPK